jgi:hypothetical protein
MQIIKMYAGTAKTYFKEKSDKGRARPFRSNLNLNFTEQVLDCNKQVEQMAMQQRERVQKRALLKQRSGGLLARELKDLGVTFDPIGNAILPTR